MTSAPFAWGQQHCWRSRVGCADTEQALAPPAMYMEHAKPSQELQEGPEQETLSGNCQLGSRQKNSLGETQPLLHTKARRRAAKEDWWGGDRKEGAARAASPGNGWRHLFPSLRLLPPHRPRGRPKPQGRHPHSPLLLLVKSPRQTDVLLIVTPSTLHVGKGHFTFGRGSQYRPCPILTSPWLDPRPPNSVSGWHSSREPGSDGARLL